MSRTRVSWRRGRLVPRRFVTMGTLAALLAAAVVAAVGATGAPALAGTSQFKGVNWADPRDNYADNPVVPSGLSTADSYATTYAKATAVIGGFQSNLGANTVRLPINPYTVNGSFWSSYTGAIDAAVDRGFKVILSYWEGTAHKDGLVDDTTAFWSMWQTVVNRYGGNSMVHFEPMNEPFGYSQSAWANLAANWISTYPSVPKNRIFVSGTGYNDDVTSVCADSRLSGTYLSLHHYGFWNSSQSSYWYWANDLRNRIGSCASRTVLDEWGAPMTTGLNYNGPINGNAYIAYIQADSDTLRLLGMGSVYWPGLRTGDSYSMATLGGSGTNLTLTNNNASGVSRLQWAWGLGGSTAAVIRGVGSNRCLDVPGSSTTWGTKLQIWDCNGGGNQSWLLTPSKTLVVYGKLCLDVPGGSVSAGTRVETWDCGGNGNQQWNINSDGTITNVQSGLCLDVTGAGTANGTAVELWYCNGAANQRWTRS
ncbi:Ricin-type beta-trefoil lectin domain-containing protein [Micromonospora narathiwatensis]|uniref:Ricin-type beta-trefoil lectin domain-containing protein n=2 Tax=Micromonospora narathiwatensis TaxID=299146 RepID=A0A1A8ZGH6_9ACTN|nr:Ricin-type beta-trefoil lectin domain-containing protein [Micromonospora narathiwatensis]